MGKVKASATAKAKERAAAREPIASSAAMASAGAGAKEARTANILHSVRGAGVAFNEFPCLLWVTHRSAAYRPLIKLCRS